MSIVGLRTAHELRGISCIPMEDAPKPKQSIIVSRSFGQPVTTLAGMLEAIISYTTRAGEELRTQGLVAKHIQVFLNTNRFNNDAPYANAVTLEFPIATSYTPELIEYATNGIKRIYRHGFRYKKCGLMMLGLCLYAALMEPRKVFTCKFKSSACFDSMFAADNISLVATEVVSVDF